MRFDWHMQIWRMQKLRELGPYRNRWINQLQLLFSFVNNEIYNVNTIYCLIVLSSYGGFYSVIISCTSTHQCVADCVENGVCVTLMRRKGRGICSARTNMYGTAENLSFEIFYILFVRARNLHFAIFRSFRIIIIIYRAFFLIVNEKLIKSKGNFLLSARHGVRCK